MTDPARPPAPRLRRGLLGAWALLVAGAVTAGWFRLAAAAQAPPGAGAALDPLLQLRWGPFPPGLPRPELADAMAAARPYHLLARAGHLALGILWLLGFLQLLRGLPGTTRHLREAAPYAGAAAALGMVQVVEAGAAGSLPPGLLVDRALGGVLLEPVLALVLGAAGFAWLTRAGPAPAAPRPGSGLAAGLLAVAWTAFLVATASPAPGPLAAEQELLRGIAGVAPVEGPARAAGAAGAAVIEEMTYRVGVLGGLLLLGRGHAGPAVLGSAVLWAGMHAGLVEPGWWKFLQLLPVGLILGWLVLRRGVGAAVLAHLVLNLAAAGFLPRVT